MKPNKIILFSLIFVVISSVMPMSLFAAEINLDTALKSALENNNILKSAREHLQAAEMQKKSAESIMNSKLRGELSWQDEELTEAGNIFSTINYSKFLAEKLAETKEYKDYITLLFRTKNNTFNTVSVSY